MKKHRATNETKGLLNLLVIFVIVLLCLSKVASAKVASACPDPECDDCYTWNGQQCVWDCDSGGTCCSGSCCYTECCGGTCCGSGQTCCGTCCDPANCCGGICCDPSEICCNGECSSGCWTTEPESATFIQCPDCDNDQAGCHGTTESTDEYSKCVTATTGQSGKTKCTSKQDIVGYKYVCDDADWDVSKIIGCVAGAGVCIFTCAVPNGVCVLCLIAEGATCALDGLCGFVDSCGPSEGQQGTPIKRSVVDYYGGCECTG